jgi:hypothetical protein
MNLLYLNEFMIFKSIFNLEYFLLQLLPTEVIVSQLVLLDIYIKIYYFRFIRQIIFYKWKYQDFKSKII